MPTQHLPKAIYLLAFFSVFLLISSLSLELLFLSFLPPLPNRCFNYPWPVMGSEQVGTGFEVVPELLGQEIRTGQPDLFRGRSGFKHQTDLTRYSKVQIDLTWPHFRYIKGLPWPDRRTGPGRGQVLVNCNVKMIYELELAQFFVTIAFGNAKAHHALSNTQCERNQQ